MILADLLGGLFGSIWDGFATVVVDVLNAIILGLGSLLNGAFVVLPPMPALPTLPGTFATGEAWVAWFVPVATVGDILTFALSMWVLWLGVSVVMRWAKFSRGSG